MCVCVCPTKQGPEAEAKADLGSAGILRPKGETGSNGERLPEGHTPWRGRAGPVLLSCGFLCPVSLCRGLGPEGPGETYDLHPSFWGMDVSTLMAVENSTLGMGRLPGIFQKSTRFYF